MFFITFVITAYENENQPINLKVGTHTTFWAKIKIIFFSTNEEKLKATQLS